MKVAVMQPYLFPYIGYFQLLNAVDKFVIYDDVNFIKKGWINRNKILLNNESHSYSIPLKKLSQNKHINEIEVSSSRDLDDFLLTVKHAYSSAPFFDQVFPLVQKIINFKDKNLSAFIFNSLKVITSYLGINSIIVPTSSQYNNKNIKGQNRVIDICLKENADVYINSIGGSGLYDKDKFRKKGIEFYFLKRKDVKYKQFVSEFVEDLSIIDVMMFNSVEDTRKMLLEFELL